MTSKSKKQPIIVWLEIFLKKNYDFRYNVVLERIEFKGKKEKEFQLLKEYDLNSIFRVISKKGFKTNIGTLMNILNSDFTPKYDPFLSYLDSLPSYEDDKDYIKELADTVKTTNDKLWHKCLKKWLIALVGSLVDEKTINHTVLVFCSGQGKGKTSWVLRLVPEKLKHYVFTGNINPANKDALIQLNQCMIINLDELEALNKGQINDLKEMITKAEIRVRKAYGRFNESLIRRASFCGSVNEKEFLSDTTGNRRFLSFNTLEIDYSHDVNMDMVFAQALHLYRSNYKFWFDEKDIAEITENNREFEKRTMDEELLLTYFTPCKKEEAKTFLTTTDIASWIAERRNFTINEASKQRLGKALNKNKFQRVKKDGRYVYALKIKPLTETVKIADAKDEPK